MENFSKEKESRRLNSARKQIWDALNEGKHLNMVTAHALCGTWDLRSHISKLRRRIEDHNLPCKIVDRWLVMSESCRCKEYWMEKVA